jgi:hypothetical protein
MLVILAFRVHGLQSSYQQRTAPAGSRDRQGRAGERYVFQHVPDPHGR